ncbi:MAG: O-antigen ligase family protein [Planctomycetaceae bacterium]|jgi:hypothetical protein|nr:O-antigen ligase family protein [Planctomycetaceae bacterium]
MSKFFFADEKPALTSFFLVAARRMAILFPLAGTVSISAIAVVKILLLIFWLFSGDWKSRIKMCRQNPVMLILILLIFWTFIGVIRWAITDADMILPALSHWWSRYSFFCLLILATLYFDKKTRIKALAMFNVAMLIFCVNLLLVRNGVWTNDKPSCFLLFNTITTGLVLVMWSAVWLLYSFQSRNIPLVRRILPVSFLIGMKVAARTSLIDLFIALIPFVRVKRLPVFGIIFALVRWGVVCLIIYFVFVLNPSRTAQLAMTAVIVSGLLMWKGRKGLVIAIVLIACILGMALSNKAFVKKWKATYRGINDVVTKDVDEIGRVQKDRHWILVKLIPEIKKRPIAGYGLDIKFKLVSSLLPYSSSKGFIHTHCDFTQIAVQFGLVGLGLFVIFLLVTFFYSAYTSPPINCFTIAVMLLVVIDMLFNVPLYFCRQKYVELFILAVVISEILYCRSIRKNRSLEAALIFGGKKEN